MEVQEHEDHQNFPIQSAASLRVKSKDSYEDYDAARRESKTPTLGKTKHHENQGLKGQNHNQRRGEEGDLLKDVISTKKSLYYSKRTDYKSLNSAYHTIILPAKWNLDYVRITRLI